MHGAATGGFWKVNNNRQTGIIHAELGAPPNQQCIYYFFTSRYPLSLRQFQPQRWGLGAQTERTQEKPSSCSSRCTLREWRSFPIFYFLFLSSIFSRSSPWQPPGTSSSEGGEPYSPVGGAAVPGTGSKEQTPVALFPRCPLMRVCHRARPREPQLSGQRALGSLRKLENTRETVDTTELEEPAP